MRRLANGLLSLAAVLLVATLAACGHSGGGGALSSLSPTRSALSRTASAPSTPQPSATQPSATSSASAPAPTQTRGTAPAANAQPSVSTTPANSGSSSTALWLWIILGAVVVIGAVVWIVLASRHRSAATAASADWRSRVIDAYASGAALHDAIGVAETPGALAGADAGARWFDIQRRADDLTQTLYAMREAAPDEVERSRVADVLATLHALRSAMDAERAPDGAGMQQADVVRGRMLNFESALRAFRATGDPAPR
jgi:hypothetical protein